MTVVTSDLRGKRWDILETVGVPISVAVTSTDPDGNPQPYPGVIAFRVYGAETIQTEAVVAGNVASGTILDSAASTLLGEGSTRWAMLDTQTGDELIAGYLILSAPGVARSEGNGVSDVAVLVGPANVTLTGVIVAQSVETGGGGVTDPEIVRDTVAAFLVAGLNVELVHDDTANTLSIAIPNVNAHIANQQVHIQASANFVEGDIAVWNGTAWTAEPNRANDLFANVKAGVALSTVGRVVSITGFQAGRPIVGLAASSHVPYGVVFEPIDVNQNGTVITSGLVTGVNTSAWPINTHLWVSATSPGVLSNVPVVGSHAVAFVVNQANNGTIRVIPHTELAE